MFSLNLFKLVFILMYISLDQWPVTSRIKTSCSHLIILYIMSLLCKQSSICSILKSPDKEERTVIRRRQQIKEKNYTERYDSSFLQQLFPKLKKIICSWLYTVAVQLITACSYKTTKWNNISITNWVPLAILQKTMSFQRK